MYKFLMVCLLIVTSMTATAEELMFELGYTNVAASGGSVDINLGAIYGSIGYTLGRQGSVSHQVEGTVIFGVGDDSSGLVDFELEPSIEFGYRGTLQAASPDLRYFWKASYTGLEIEASSSVLAGTVIDGEGGPGLGVGLEWKGLTIGYAQYFGDLDNFSRLNVGYRF